MHPTAYTWSATPSNSNVWTRKLQGWELLTSFFTNTFDSHWNMIFGATCKITRGSITPSDIRRAWIHLRLQHPAIATFTRPSSEAPEDPSELLYFVESASQVEEWANNTIIHHHEGGGVKDPVAAALELQLQLQNGWHLDGETRRLANLHWRMVGNETIIFFLKVSHVPTDGRATISFFDIFMKALISSDFSEAITWGDETSRLPNPFAVAYGLWKEDQQPTAEFGSWIQSVAEKTELQQAFTYPVRSDPSPTPEISHSCLVSIASPTFKRFHAVCSNHHLTVTEATSLVVLIAQLATLHRHYKIFDLPQPDVFGSIHATDNRRYAAGAEAYDGCGAGLIPVVCKTELLRRIVERGMANPSGTINIDKSFWDDLAPVMRQQWEDAKSDASFCVYSHDIVNGMLSMAQTNPEALPMGGPVISSIGIVEAFASREYNSDRLSLEFSRVFGTVRNTLPMIVCHFWMFRNDFSFHYTARDEFYPSQFVKDCAQETERWINAVAAEFDSRARM